MKKKIVDSKDVCYYGHASKFARREKILYTKPFPLLDSWFGYNILYFSQMILQFMLANFDLYLFFYIIKKCQQTAPLRDQHKVMKQF